MPWRRYKTYASPLLLAAAFLGLPCTSLVSAAEESPARSFEDALLSIRLSPRTPQQVAAFYEARGFPPRAVHVLKQSCFVTVRIHNRSNTVVWLEPDNWRFLVRKDEIRRLDRPHWTGQWQRLGVSQANRSTFGWTLLPESRDLQPDEPVGGNITLPRTDRPFAVEARFATGADKQGKTLTVRFDDVRCAEDIP